jgi:nucleotide-binding universal stress UspA family protein
MFNKILVPVDISTKATTEKLCMAANELAQKYNAEVSLISVLPDYGMPLVASYFPEGAQDKVKAEITQELEKLAETYFKPQPKIRLVQGKRRQSILKEVDAFSADLVMIGCRRKKSRSNQRLLGSTGSAISDRAGCSVLVVR